MASKLAPYVGEGKKADAYKFKQKYGGEIYTGRKDAWFTVEGGQRRAVFWNPGENGQKVKAETYQLAQQLGFPIGQYPDLTPSKIGKMFWTDVIGINPQKDKREKKKSGYYGKEWEALAKRYKSGSKETDEDEELSHWQFSLFNPHEPQHLIDRDIKSAFSSALIQAPTLYLHEAPNGTSTFIDDGGAMQRLREWHPHLPKWFKHRMVGMLASHKYGIKWGAAFNSAQWAILKVYKTMEKAAEIAGDNCARAFVDCLTLKASTPKEVVQAIDNYFASEEFSLGTKALGYGQLWSPVEGFIGYCNPIGLKIEVEAQMERRRVASSKRAYTDELVQNFGDRLSTHVLEVNGRKTLGHWNGVAFFSICQPVAGHHPNKSEWFTVYPDDRDPEERERKLRQIEPYIFKL
jgi:hypothetical protein